VARLLRLPRRVAGSLRQRSRRVVGRAATAKRRESQPVAVPAALPPATERDFFLAVAVLGDRLAGVVAPPVDLARAELRASSQNGEDGVLVEILRRIGLPERPSFVEFGIETGHEGNCVFLADVLGWSGAFLEADPAQHAVLAAKYAMNERVRTLCAAVTPQNVDDLFARLGVPAEPDVVSIDIDGPDYWVWRALERHTPRVVVVEYNGNLGADDALTVPADHGGWDGTDYFGASLAALERLGRAKGYALVHTDLTGVNAFFVREELARAFPEAARRRSPNYLLRSLAHARDPAQRPWVRDPPV